MNKIQLNKLEAVRMIVMINRNESSVADMWHGHFFLFNIKQQLFEFEKSQGISMQTNCD